MTATDKTPSPDILAQHARRPLVEIVSRFATPVATGVPLLVELAIASK
jgi:hypothetical protein